MPTLEKALNQAAIVYVCRDPERADCLDHHFKNYHIITNKSKTAQRLDTRELLTRPATAATIEGLGKKTRVLVFKNTPLIEKICAKKKWKLLNPAAKLAAEVEEKISQVRWLGPLARYLPPRRVVTAKELAWNGRPYIVQFNRAHTGAGTILIKSKTQLDRLKQKFPDRPVRATDFINGPTFTSNNIVWGKKIFAGNISYQITGLPPFTDQPFATIGNDWKLPKKLLNKKQTAEFRKMARAIGKKLATAGWKGMFGLDAILDNKSGKIFLLEINARQPASAAYESRLQSNLRQEAGSHTTFEAHLASLLNLNPADSQSPAAALITIRDGSQIVRRVQSNRPMAAKKLKEAFKKLAVLNCRVIRYQNINPGADLARVQCQHSLMSGHNRLNAIGKQIAKILS